jgi:hypothetical protein
MLRLLLAKNTQKHTKKEATYAAAPHEWRVAMECSSWPTMAEWEDGLWVHGREKVA